MFLKDLLKLATEREYTDEGFLRVPARISRTGTQIYRAFEMGLSDGDPNREIVIYRPQEEVFNEASLSSFASKPITNDHPPELVNAANSKKYTVGLSAPEVIRDGDFVKTVLNITDEQAIKDIESGKSELSNGYTCDIDWTPGVTPEGETYDAVQRNIKGNHIAIVERGRAGFSCRVADNSLNGDSLMKKITIGGVEYEVSDQVAQVVGNLQKQLKDAEEETKKKEDEMEEELKKKEDEMEEVKKEAKKTEDSLKAKLDDAKSKILTPKDIDKLVSDRMSFVDSVSKICPDMIVDGKTNEELVREVVKTKCPNVQLDSVSSDYIKARFDMLLESTGSSSALDEAFRQQATIDLKTTQDNRPADVIAREKHMADSRNAWKFGGNK